MKTDVVGCDFSSVSGGAWPSQLIAAASVARPRRPCTLEPREIAAPNTALDPTRNLPATCGRIAHQAPTDTPPDSCPQNHARADYIQCVETILLYPVYTTKLARRAGYMLAGRDSSKFARCLLDICSTFARYLLDSVNGVLVCGRLTGRVKRLVRPPVCLAPAPNLTFISKGQKVKVIERQEPQKWCLLLSTVTYVYFFNGDVSRAGQTAQAPRAAPVPTVNWA